MKKKPVVTPLKEKTYCIFGVEVSADGTTNRLDKELRYDVFASDLPDLLHETLDEGDYDVVAAVEIVALYTMKKAVVQL
jgi:hypothetical protein